MIWWHSPSRGGWWWCGRQEMWHSAASDGSWSMLLALVHLYLTSHSPLHFSLLVVTTLTTVYHLLPPQCLFNSTAFVFMKFLIDKAKSPMISWWEAQELGLVPATVQYSLVQYSTVQLGLVPAVQHSSFPRHYPPLINPIFHPAAAAGWPLWLQD